MNKFLISIFFVLFYIAFAIVLCHTLDREKRFDDIDYQDFYDKLLIDSTATPSQIGFTPEILRNCLQTRCQALKVYDPVCGSDMRTYENIEDLNCNIFCGSNITLLKVGTCVPVTEG